MYAARFGLYLGHPQACQYKNHTKVNTIRILGGGALFTVTTLIMLKHKIYVVKE
jgi:hypothetical protein